MTVSSENQKVSYDGNDVTTVFPYNFKIYDEDHLTVIHTDSDGVETTLVLNTDYTVSGVGEEAGGNVTYPISGSPLAIGEKLTVLRELDLLQETDFHNQGGFYPDTAETQLDYDVMMMQQLQEQLDRCVKVTVSSGEDPDDLRDDLLNAVANAEAAADAAAASEENAAAHEENAAAMSLLISWFHLGKE